MTLQRLRNLAGRYRITLRVALLVALALTVYVPLMLSAERQAAQRLEELRAEDPQAYLEVLKREEGFDAYLAAFARLRGFDDWRAAPPVFLHGRWRLYETRQYVDDSFAPEPCTPAVRFLEGSVRLPSAPARDALYTIQNAHIAVQRPGASTLSIDPVAPRQSVHYLRIEGLPQGLRFAYRCS
ncbi:hypothetical protein CKO28_06705 [Rhodovibrio sodomensis]|uniref:Uncharacterized protein n=1 Tax=Rhodovibrio sodomensis TaxID=1088 RepID=A0ABS1DB90_9PROT|nr:hypothetical protein [Rhodovibrio sodomensis]MBK1667723.1 hypothetical protein [Rhodovibrio sodomensis]